MGGNGPDLLNMGPVDLNKVISSFNEFGTRFATNHLSDNYVHARPYYELCKNSIDTLYELLTPTERGEQTLQYQQALQAIPEIERAINIILQKPNEENLQKLNQITGHFIDRIAFHILQKHGKTAADTVYKNFIAEYSKITKMSQTLLSALDVLKAIFKKQTIQSLWFNFEQEKKKARRLSWAWAFGAVLTLATLIYTTYCDLSANLVFLNDLKITEKTPTLYIILAYLPKITLKVILVVLSVVFFRIFMTYKHLENVYLSKENAAKAVRIVLLEDQSKPFQEKVYAEFITQIMKTDDTGFLQLAKEKAQIDVKTLTKPP